jgi:hypothetical protein
MRKLFVMPHDGTWDGESAFYYPDSALPYKHGMTLEDVRTAYVKQQLGDNKQNPFCDPTDYVQQEAAEMKGAWILTQATMDILHEIVEAADPGSDGAVYRCNTICKRVSQRLAVRVLGTWVK